MSDDDCRRPPAETITRDDARSDLAIVEEVLRGGYAGYKVRAAEGHDWERSFESARMAFHHPDPAKIAREGYGHQPDLWLDAEDPLAATIGIARCMKTKRCADELWTHVSAAQPALPRRAEPHVRP